MEVLESNSNDSCISNRKQIIKHLSFYKSHLSYDLEDIGEDQIVYYQLMHLMWFPISYY